MAYSDTLLALSPVAYYRLGDAANATAVADASGNGHDLGTLQGGYTLGEPGAVAGDTAVTFSGVGGSLSAPAAALPNPSPTDTGDFAVVFWLKTVQSEFAETVSCVNDFFTCGIDGGKAWFKLHSDVQHNGTGTVNDGNWHMVAITRVSGDARIYIDGSLDTDIGTLDLSCFFSVGTILGGDNANLPTGFPFLGSLDEVSFHTTGLSATDISNLHTAGAGGGGVGATTFTLTAPSPAKGDVTVGSGDFTVTPDAAYTGTVTVTPSGGGLSTPIVLTFSDSATPQTFTITPVLFGTVTLTPTNSGGLANPSPVTYLAMVQLGSTTMGPDVGTSPAFGGFDLLAQGTWLPELKRDITGDAVDSGSDTVINTMIGESAPGVPYNIYLDFSGPGTSATFGMPVNVVPGTQSALPVTMTVYPAADPPTLDSPSDVGPYRINPNGAFEGYYNPGVAPSDDPSGFDRHCLTAIRNETSGGIDTVEDLYDVWSADGGATWNAHGGARFDLATGATRPDGVSSADAAGLPILPLVTRYEEVASGDIGHAIRGTFGRSVCSSRYVWPARHSVNNNGLVGLHFGGRIRLSSAWYAAHAADYTGQARVFVDAMRKYGIINADVTGDDHRPHLIATSDARWDVTGTTSSILLLNSIPATAFEVAYQRPGFTLTGPTSGAAGVAQTYTVTRNPANDTNFFANVYLSVNGTANAAGLSVASVALSDGSPSATFTFTPPSAGSYDLTGEDGSNVWVPAPALTLAATATATAYTLEGPASGTVNVASSAFTVTPNGSYTGTITPASSGSGTFSPTSLTFSGSAAPQTFTYTPATTTGSPHQVSTTASPALGTDPAAIAYTVNPAPSSVAYTSITDGNWSDAIWSPAGTPGAGDTATINHAVAITSDTTIGDGTDTTVLSVATTASSLTIAGATLTIRGNATFGAYNSGNVRLYLDVANAGTTPGGIELDGNAGVAPLISFDFDSMLRVLGTPSARCFIRTKSGTAGGPGRFAAVGGSDRNLFIDASDTDFARLGDAANAGLSAPTATWWASGPSGYARPPIKFSGCAFDSCGKIPSVALGQSGQIDFDLEVTDCNWTNGADADYLCQIGMGTGVPINGGTRLIDGCKFFGLPPYFPNPHDLTFTGNYFDDTLVTNGSVPLWAEFSGNFARVRRGNTEHQWGGGTSGNYCLYNPTISDASGTHFFLVGQGSGSPLDTTHDGNVFEAIGSAFADHSCIGESEADSGLRTCAATNNLMLPGFGKLLVTNSQDTTRANVNGEHHTVCEHNTGILGDVSSLVECGVQDAATIDSFRSNLAYRSGTGAGSGIYLFKNRDTAPVDDVFKNTSGGLPSFADYNAAFGLDTVSSADASNGTRYNTGLTVVPGSHDVEADPGFVDPTRGLLAWDASLGGAGTLASALARIQADPSLTSSSLIPWVRAGFAPTNPVLAGAAHDGTDIGAMAVAATPTPTPTPTSYPASMLMCM